MAPQRATDVYEICPCKDKRGVDLISGALPFGRLWYGEPDAVANAIGYAKFFSRSQHAVIRLAGLAAQGEFLSVYWSSRTGVFPLGFDEVGEVPMAMAPE
jgi:hypothetical protein